MISKTISTRKTFGQSILYVCEEQKQAQILAVEGVRKHDLHLMIQDFETQQALANQLKERPVFHLVLSFPHGERLTDEKLAEIGRRYLQEIKMVNTQHVIVKHADKEHLHLHILANQVSNTGIILGKRQETWRGIKIAEELTNEYKLQPKQGKHLDQTNRQALSRLNAKQYRLYETIKEILPECRQMEDLEKRLLERGIDTRYRIDKESGMRQGISFRIENFAFKGSHVDPAYSLKGLERTLALQQKQALEQRQARLEAQALEQRQALELEQAKAQKQALEQEVQRQAQAERQQQEMKQQQLRRGRGPRLTQ